MVTTIATLVFSLTTNLVSGGGEVGFLVYRGRRDVISKINKNSRVIKNGKKLCSRLGGEYNVTSKQCRCGVRNPTFFTKSNGRPSCCHSPLVCSDSSKLKTSIPSHTMVQADIFMDQVRGTPISSNHVFNCSRYFIWNIDQVESRSFSTKRRTRWNSSWVDISDIALHHFQVERVKKKENSIISLTLDLKLWGGNIIKISCAEGDVIVKINGSVKYPLLMSKYRSALDHSYKLIQHDGNPNDFVWFIFACLTLVFVFILVFVSSLCAYYRKRQRYGTSCHSLDPFQNDERVVYQNLIRSSSLDESQMDLEVTAMVGTHNEFQSSRIEIEVPEKTKNEKEENDGSSYSSVATCHSIDTTSRTWDPRTEGSLTTQECCSVTQSIDARNSFFTNPMFEPYAFEVE